jgi:hypothetical protein
VVAKRNAKPQYGSSRGVSPSRKPWLVQALELGTAAHGCRAVDQRQKPDFQPWTFFAVTNLQNRDYGVGFSNRNDRPQIMDPIAITPFRRPCNDFASDGGIGMRGKLFKEVECLGGATWSIARKSFSVRGSNSTFQAIETQFTPHFSKRNRLGLLFPQCQPAPRNHP